jgi:seryl-tRNA synthetase
MLDPQLLRSDLGSVATALLSRGYTFDVQSFQELELQRKSLQVQVETVRALRNQQSKKIGQLKAVGEDAAPVLAEVTGLGDQLAVAEQELGSIQLALDKLLEEIPNIPADGVPDGLSEDENIELRALKTLILRYPIMLILVMPCGRWILRQQLK